MKRQIAQAVAIMQSQLVMQSALTECCEKLSDIINEYHTKIVQGVTESTNLVESAKLATSALGEVIGEELQKMKKVVQPVGRKK
jgi:hypothetical protein